MTMFHWLTRSNETSIHIAMRKNTVQSWCSQCYSEQYNATRKREGPTSSHKSQHWNDKQNTNAFLDATLAWSSHSLNMTLLLRSASPTHHATHDTESLSQSGKPHNYQVHTSTTRQEEEAIQTYSLWSGSPISLTKVISFQWHKVAVSWLKSFSGRRKGFCLTSDRHLLTFNTTPVEDDFSCTATIARNQSNCTGSFSKTRRILRHWTLWTDQWALWQAFEQYRYSFHLEQTCSTHSCSIPSTLNSGEAQLTNKSGFMGDRMMDFTLNRPLENTTADAIKSKSNVFRIGP